MTSESSGVFGEDVPLPRVLCDTAALAALDDASAGALWRLAEPGRQLDANVVRLPPGHGVDTHREPDLDVLLLVLAGHGTLTAGPEGLTYLTVHRRRPGMRIQRRDPALQQP